MRAVFKEKRRLQKLNKSSRLGPRRSIIMTLKSPSLPYQWIFGTPTFAEERVNDPGGVWRERSGAEHVCSRARVSLGRGDTWPWGARAGV